MPVFRCTTLALALILALASPVHATSTTDKTSDPTSQSAQTETTAKIDKDELRILPQLPSEVAGDIISYRTVEGDSIAKLASTYGIDSRVLANLLGRKIDDLWTPDVTPLPVDEEIVLDTRHIVPTGVKDGLLISLAQRRIYLFRDGKLVQSHLIAAGHPLKPTPRGRFKIIEMKKDKPWIVPLSVQQEMRE